MPVFVPSKTGRALEFNWCRLGLPTLSRLPAREPRRSYIQHDP